MINASGPNGVPIVPNQPSIGASPVPTEAVTVGSTNTRPTTQPTPGINPTQPTTTPPTPANAPAGGAGTGTTPLKKPGKKIPFKLIIGGIVLLLMIIGAIAGYFLTQMNQDVRQQAKIAEIPYLSKQCIAKLGLKEYESSLAACIEMKGTWNDEDCKCSGVISAVISDDSKIDDKAQGNAFTQKSCIEAKGGELAYNFQKNSCANDKGEWSDANCACSSAQATQVTLEQKACTDTFGGQAGYNAAKNVCTTAQGDWSDSQCKCNFKNAPTDREACIQELGSFDTYDAQSGNCAAKGDSWNDAICKCITIKTLTEGNSDNSTDKNIGGSSGSSNNTTNTANSAAGSGSCAACLGLGGQAERDCYATCDGTIQTGLCAGMSTSQCQQACAQAGGTPQVCTGTQEASGTPRAGEFLSCSSSGSVNGCGQFDCLNSSGTLIGFVIDNSQCTASGGTPSNNNQNNTTTTRTTPRPTPTPTLNPDLPACNEACSQDNNCADANHTCSEGVCRLTSNPNSTTCQAPDGTTPTATPQISPTPNPTTNPDLANCNEACSSHNDCADLLHSCQGNVCRLTSNPGSTSCSRPDNTQPPAVPRTPNTPPQCNAPCTSNTQCTTFNHVCHQGTCRLSSNLDSVSCSAAITYQSNTTQLGQMNQQPNTPTVLPSSGAKDFAAWLLAGVGAVVAGAVILLLL